MSMPASALLADAAFEIIPLKGIIEKARLLPVGATVTVTASPAKGMDPTIDLALELAEAGYRTVPHLSARMIRDRTQLAGIVKRLADGGVERVFVIGGDAQEPGDFLDALSLIRELNDLGHSFHELGVAGYPEGHPTISTDKLRAALIEKQMHATYVATQMCFKGRVIADWVRSIRADGVALPVRVGIPGVVDPTKLLTIAARIGVGGSMRFMAKNRRAVFRLLRPGVYRPDRLIRSLTNQGDGLGLVGLHVFTFNQVGPTVDWYHRALKAAR